MGAKAAVLAVVVGCSAISCTADPSTSTPIPGIEITDSAGRVEMPDVIGVSLPEAIRLIEDAGLSVTTIQIEDDTQLGEPGAEDVIRQDPEPGVLVVDGADVSLTVTAIPHSMPSLGPNADLDAALPGTSWTLAQVDDRKWTAEDRLPTLTFERRRLGGFSGCNAFGGPWWTRGRTLEVGRIVSTLIACGGKAGWVEDRVHEVLEASPVVTVRSDQLVLTARPEGILVFVQDEEGPPG